MSTAWFGLGETGSGEVRRGTYVTIEGLDGVGKSTLFQAIGGQLASAGYRFESACPTRCQSPASLLERLHRQSDVLGRSSAFRAIVYAARSASVARSTDWEAPLILGDRSIITSYVTRWRRVARSATFSRLLVDVLEPGMPAPDHVLYLQADPAVLRARLSARGEPLGIDETLERSEQMRTAYEEIRNDSLIPRLARTTWHTVDAALPADDVADAAMAHLTRIVPGLLRRDDAAT